jgi:hypothetical protein
MQTNKSNQRRSRSKPSRKNTKRKSSQQPVWLASVFLLVGLGLGIGAALSFADTIGFERSALTALGKVVELEHQLCGSKDRTTCYAPRVLFTELATGRQVLFVSREAANPPAFRVGEEVTVLYAPDNPETAMVQSFFSMWGVVVILSGVCVIFVAVGAVILLFPDTFRGGSAHPTFASNFSHSSADSPPSDTASMHSADFVSSDMNG